MTPPACSAWNRRNRTSALCAQRNHQINAQFRTNAFSDFAHARHGYVGNTLWGQNCLGEVAFAPTLGRRRYREACLAGVTHWDNHHCGDRIEAAGNRRSEAMRAYLSVKWMAKSRSSLGRFFLISSKKWTNPPETLARYA